MKKKFLMLSGILGIFLMPRCQKSIVQPATLAAYDSIPQMQRLIPQVNEISGIADSKLNPGYLWGEEDSGNPPQIYLIKHDGTVVKSVFIKGVTNRDWEDMALFNNEIYIAETGDNAQSFSNYRFYKFPEPSAATDTVSAVETINFNYPDGSHDAEAFLIDPSSKDIYIITKRDNPSRLYRLSFPYATTGTVSFVGNLPYTGVVSAAVSPDGKGILVKTYTSVFYYNNDRKKIDQTLMQPYIKLPYVIEPQGEAISFAIKNNGYITLSEKGFSSAVNLFFYRKK